jgi:hypothetical protein
MKTLIILFLSVAFTGNGWAFNKGKSASPIVGSWKYDRQSEVNDFQPVLNTEQKTTVSEYFVFEQNNRFRHVFMDEKGNIIKQLSGKWKVLGDKVTISYNELNYTVNVDYFFLDKDLVLGQNFNHVIFKREDNILQDAYNTAMK